MNSIEQSELETLFKFGANVTIVDVRKKPALEKKPAMIQGAVWQDFQNVPAWADSVKSSTTVVCYCVHGHGRERNNIRRWCWILRYRPKLGRFESPARQRLGSLQVFSQGQVSCVRRRS